MNHQHPISLRPRGNQTIQCLICHDQLSDSNDLQQCPRCGASVHHDCAGDGHCQVLGCAGQLLSQSATPRPRGSFKTHTTWTELEGWMVLAAFAIGLLAFIVSGFGYGQLAGPLLLGALALNLITWAINNTSQAFLVIGALKTHSKQPDTSRKIALYGSIDTDGLELLDPRGQSCLYFMVEEQTWRTGQREGWTTTSMEEFAIPFRIHGILISNEPTEILGLQLWADTNNPVEGKRTRISTLLKPEKACALGFYKAQREAPELQRDQRLGLLISPYGPIQTARQKLLKGSIQTALAILISALILILLQNSNHF